MAIRVEGYNHVAIVVRDLEVCKWFYGDILGLKGARRPALNFPGQWYQVGQNTQLHLMVFEEVIPNTMRHFALEVEDFQDAVEHIKSQGIEFELGPFEGPTCSIAVVVDPDGNKIGIHKRKQDSSQTSAG